MTLNEFNTEYNNKSLNKNKSLRTLYYTNPSTNRHNINDISTKDDFIGKSYENSRSKFDFESQIQ